MKLGVLFCSFAVLFTMSIFAAPVPLLQFSDGKCGLSACVEFRMTITIGF
jgi:hypothetical protein